MFCSCACWYRDWDEQTRMKFLLNELTGKRPLMPPNLQTSAEQADVINTFRVIAQLPPDSLGAYVISMTRSASDVLAVVLLQVTVNLHAAFTLPNQSTASPANLFLEFASLPVNL